MKSFFILGTFILVLFSCGKKEEFKYQFEENGCNTGEQNADSKDAMCANLKDNAKNNFCALNLRKQEYTTKGCGSW
ncbi:MAG: hypothetical protein M9962_08015 [Oligoflexia bacterium]|nr:hypothetical protein [Oligoflexia bacterium]